MTDVSAESPDKGEKADKPDQGEPPAPAYEQQIAFDVDVTGADGSATTVHLDKSFNVLGTEKAEQDQGEQAGDHGDQGDHGDHGETAEAADEK